MSGDDIRAADELEAIRQLKARYGRFLDTEDVESWRGVFATGVAVRLDMAVSTAGADPMTAQAAGWSQGPANFVPTAIAGLENAATMHPAIQESHTPVISLTGGTNATGIWATEDLLVFGSIFGRARELQNGSRRINSLHLTRTILKVSGSGGD